MSFTEANNKAVFNSRQILGFGASSIVFLLSGVYMENQKLYNGPMERLSLALSVPGIIIFLLAMIPSFIFMLLAPEEQMDEERKKTHLNAEELSRDFFAFFLIAFSAEDYGNVIYLVVAVFFLALYYFAWIRYFRNGRKAEFLTSPLLSIPVPLSVFSAHYYAFSCLFINNTLALGLCVIYAFFNIKSNLKKTKEEKK